MRQLICCVLLLVAAFAARVEIQPAEIEPYIFEDIINGIIENFRPNISDPLAIDNLTITIPEELKDFLVGGFSFTDFQLTGIQGFEMRNLGYDLTNLNFTLVFPVINLNTNYWSDLTVLTLIPIYGSGEANVNLEEMAIDGTAVATLDNFKISLKNLRVRLTLGSSTFDIHGALNDENYSAILNQLLNDMVTTFIDDHQEVISNIISPILEAALNAILGGGTISTPAPNAT